MQPIHVLTNRYANTRAGVNLAETRLNVKNVNAAGFGKLFARPVDGDLYAQPLIVSGMNIRGATCNVVFLATSRNSVYAYEADDPEAGLPLWSTNLGSPVPRDDLFKKLGQTGHYLNFASEIGITSTPAIALKDGGGLLYVVAKTRSVTDLGGGVSRTYAHRIHALDLATGVHAPIPDNPMEIRATARKSDGSLITFDPLFQLNRPGLLLQDGVLYIAFGSHADIGEFYGWIMAYDAATLRQRAVYCTAPDWTEGGVWQSGCGLAGDDEGFVYAVVGNGDRPGERRPDQFPDLQSPTGIQAPVYGNAVLKLRLVAPPGRGESLEVVDWYTAPDVMDLNALDNDLMAGPVLFEAPGGDGSPRKMVLAGGKDGRFYLLDRDNLGKWAPLTGGTPSHWDPATKQWVPWQNPTRPRNALQDDQVCAFHIHGAPIIWKRRAGAEITAYVWSEKDALKALPFRSGRFVHEDLPQQTSAYRFPEDEMRMPGGFLALSADGDEEGTAIVWASYPTDSDAMNKTVKGTLRAFDARDLSNVLWDSDQDADGGDRVGSFAKFTPPVVANGKVYLATFSRELAVYGLYSDIGTTRLIRDAGIFELRGFGANVDGSGVYTCQRYDLFASGEGLKGRADSFFFAFRVIDLNEQPRIRISARLIGLNDIPPVPDNPGAMAGVMIRKFGEANDVPGLRYAAAVGTGANNALFLGRNKDGANSSRYAQPVAAALPRWLRLSCEPAASAGSFSFRAEVSADGFAWQAVGDPVSIPMDGRVMVGLAATAQAVTPPGQVAPKVQARFSDVVVTPVT